MAIKDNGKRETFSSGMVRDVTEGKTDYLLTRDGPMFERWAKHLTAGAAKYTRTLPLTLGNWLGVLNSCTCHKNVLISTQVDISLASVEAVTKKAFANAIQNLPNGNERTPDSGQIAIEVGKELIITTTELPAVPVLNSSTDGDLSQKTNQHSVNYVDAMPGKALYPWITITLQDFLEVFSVDNATSLLVTSKTARNYLEGHSPTCKLIRYVVKGTHIELPGKRNWMLASGEAELERFRISAARHFEQALRGDTDEDHFAAVFFNLNGIVYVLEQIEKEAK